MDSFTLTPRQESALRKLAATGTASGLGSMRQLEDRWLVYRSPNGWHVGGPGTAWLAAHQPGAT